MKQSSVKNICLASLLVAFTALCAMISIPMPFGISYTLQLFGVTLMGFMLPIKYSLPSYACYLALGAMGLPVFSGLSGGAGVLIGPTGGFLWGFAVLIIACRLSLRLRRAAAFLIMMSGFALFYLIGSIYYSLLTSTPYPTALLISCAPFILKDILLCFFARSISKRISLK